MQMFEYDLRREEVRGIFTLGLLAIFVTIRYLSGLPEITQVGLFSNVPIHLILDLVIFTWAFYAFCMVFALSGDILPKSVCDWFRALAKYCLLISIASLTFACIVVFLLNLWFIVPLIAFYPVVYLIIKAIEKYRKKRE